MAKAADVKMHAGLLSSVASEFQTACVQKVHSKDTTDDSVGVRAPYEDSLTVSLSSLNDALSSVDKIEEKVEVINVQLASDLDGSDVQGIGKEVLEENDDVVNVVVDPGNKKLQIEKKRVLVQIGPQHFDLLKLIGEGAFGKVILVRNRLNKKIYAMKVLSKKLLRKKNNVQYMKSERDILTRISHPFVVPLYFAFQSEKKLFLVMEFLAGGELFFHLRRRGLILEKEVRFYLAEMVLAIEFLHNNNVIHRDLKPENVLLTKEGHVCITDFGLAKEIGDATSVRTLCGTSEYMAPEMLTRNGYGKAVDWWALGALCYEMLVGRPPFTGKNQKELDRKILSEKLFTPPYLSQHTHSLLKGLLEKDVAKRLGAAKSTMFSIGGVMALKMHNFFEGVDWFAVENMEITPPILLSSEAGTNTPSGKSTGNLTTDPHGAEGTDEYYLATNFDKEFTGQAISISVIEDTLYSGQTSPMRSRANSDPKEDEFKDFEFTSTSFECTEDQLQEFDRYLQVKVQKAKKKKLLKAKKEEKQAIEEAEKKAKEDEEKQKKLAEVEEKKKKQLADEEKKKQEAEKLRLKRERDARNAEIKAHNAIVEKYLSKLEECQKKLKNLRRKARKIEEVEEKIKSNKDTDPNYVITKEQADRIARLGVLMDEISELEEEETDILQQNPGELLDLITGDSSRNVSKNEGKGSLTEHRKESKVLALSAPPVLTPAPQTNSSTDKVQKNSDDNWLAVSNSKKQNKKKK